MIIEEVTIVPSPIQNTIPIWLGGSADAVIERAAELGDGWMPILSPDDTAKIALDKLNNQLDNLNRSRDDFGIEAWLRFHENDPDKLGKNSRWMERIRCRYKFGYFRLYPIYIVEGKRGLMAK